ncbi:MAG: sensor histidine kinase, partial [Betaproteobacteria bacterium]|nr:sensor histidine kinase [Betaproteobacteria bacterium]
AVQAANEAFDRSLYLAARTLAEDLQWQEGQLRLLNHAGTGYLFENHIGSRLFHRVSDVQGQWLMGHPDLPSVGATAEPVHFFALVAFADADYRSQPVRLARLTHVLSSVGQAPLIVQVTVAETREAREALIQTILRETLGSQGLMLLAVAVLVLLAVRRAVQPLERLRRLIEAKADDDLQALPHQPWPAELQPLVRTIDGHTQRLARLIRIRKRFLDNAAHQLRTPLTALKTQLALLQRQPAASDELLQAALRSTDDAVRLTAQLLALTRAEHLPDMERHSEVDVAALARQVTADQLWRAHARGDDLGLELSAEPVRVQGHAMLLQEALGNLIDNALHHGGPGVRVTVRVGLHWLEVEDDGPGIAPAHQGHVFERFYRAAMPGVSGSGLGLAIVQEIARQHGASVQLHSPLAQGRGTCIRLQWPQTSPPTAPGASPQGAADRPGAARRAQA